MEPDELRREFDRLEPWITQFEIDGKIYGGWYKAMTDARLGRFFDAFPNAGRVLELGSLEGGHSVALARNAAVSEVVGVEGREENLARAELVARAFGAANVTFQLADLETYDLGSLGRFDTVFCVGLLYHLPRPWEFLRRVRAVCGRLFLCTHHAPETDSPLIEHGYHGRGYTEFGRDEPLSGLSSTSFWPNLSSLEHMLRDEGFDQIDRLALEGSPNGPLCTLAAQSTLTA